MKKIILTLSFVLVAVIVILAQVPTGFNYQAVLRNSNGQVLAGQAASIRISLTNGDGTTTHYSETHAVTSNSLGMIDVVVGKGQETTGNFEEVILNTPQLFLNIELKLSGATNYAQIGRQQLQAVPYALFAGNDNTMAWLGSFDTAPLNPKLNEAYHNLQDSVSYLWNGTAWQLLTQKGASGEKGDKGDQGIPGNPGVDGKSINWLGSLPAEPVEKSLNDGYYNSVDKKSYIWDGDSWEIIAIDGLQGETGEPGPLVSGVLGQTLIHNGTDWIASSLLYNNGTNIGINTTSPTQLLDVNGSIRIRGDMYDIDNNAGIDGQILGRNSNGLAWKTPDWIKGYGTIGQMAVWASSDSVGSIPLITYTNSMQVQSVAAPASDDDPIFEVKNKLGQVVFGVYQGGVRIYVEDSQITKGVKGGFAVGGLTNQSKAQAEYFRITPDSARIWVKEVPSVKGAKGGFAVGGLTNQTKATVSSQLIQLTPKNYFVGYESGVSIANGLYNSFFGHQSGKGNTDGSYNVFVGYHSGMNNTTGTHNVFIGHESGLSNTSGWSNNFIGQSAGYSNVDGTNNVFIGNEAGKLNVASSGNIFIGRNAGYSSTEHSNTIIGHTAGEFLATGTNNTFLGTLAAYERAGGSGNLILGSYANRYGGTGDNNTILGTGAGFSMLGSGNVFVGYNAGYSETGDNKLYISNSSTSNPLIYGEFNTQKVTLNASVNVRDFMVLEPQSSAPASPSKGTVYFDGNDNKMKVWDGTTWQSCW